MRLFGRRKAVHPDVSPNLVTLQRDNETLQRDKEELIKRVHELEGMNETLEAELSTTYNQGTIRRIEKLEQALFHLRQNDHVKITELKIDIVELKAALQESQNENEELKKHVGSAQCCLCFDPKRLDQFSVMGCGHAFCTDCMILVHQQVDFDVVSCPMCRSPGGYRPLRLSTV